MIRKVAQPIGCMIYIYILPTFRWFMGNVVGTCQGLFLLGIPIYHPRRSSNIQWFHSHISTGNKRTSAGRVWCRFVSLCTVVYMYIYIYIPFYVYTYQEWFHWKPCFCRQAYPIGLPNHCLEKTSGFWQAIRQLLALSFSHMSLYNQIIIFCSPLFGEDSHFEDHKLNHQPELHVS